MIRLCNWNNRTEVQVVSSLEMPACRVTSRCGVRTTRERLKRSNQNLRMLPTCFLAQDGQSVGSRSNAQIQTAVCHGDWREKLHISLFEHLKESDAAHHMSSMKSQKGKEMCDPALHVQSERRVHGCHSDSCHFGPMWSTQF